MFLLSSSSLNFFFIRCSLYLTTSNICRILNAPKIFHFDGSRNIVKHQRYPRCMRSPGQQSCSCKYHNNQNWCYFRLLKSLLVEFNHLKLDKTFTTIFWLFVDQSVWKCYDYKYQNSSIITNLVNLTKQPGVWGGNLRIVQAAIRMSMHLYFVISFFPILQDINSSCNCSIVYFCTFCSLQQ